MNERIKKLREGLRVDHFQICVEKAALVVESLRETEGEPEILRRAKATANFLDNRTVFIEDDELIVGNVASKPMGMEAGTMGPTWPEEERGNPSIAMSGRPNLPMPSVTARLKAPVS